MTFPTDSQVKKAARLAMFVAVIVALRMVALLPLWSFAGEGYLIIIMAFAAWTFLHGRWK